MYTVAIMDNLHIPNENGKCVLVPLCTTFARTGKSPILTVVPLSLHYTHWNESYGLSTPNNISGITEWIQWLLALVALQDCASAAVSALWWITYISERQPTDTLACSRDVGLIGWSQVTYSTICSSRITGMVTWHYSGTSLQRPSLVPSWPV